MVAFHAFGVNKQHKIVITGNFITAHHISFLAHFSFKQLLKARMLVIHFHHHKNTDASTHCLWRYHCHLLSNNPFFLSVIEFDADRLLSSYALFPQALLTARSHLVGGYLKYPDLIYLIPFLILENKCKTTPKFEKNNHK